MKTKTTRDKQLRTLELKDVMERRRLDQALNMKQFALAAGISYSAAQYWFRQPGFPTFCGVVFWSDFVEWRHSRVGLKDLKNPPRPEPPPPPYYPQSRAEWLRSLPPKARRIMEEFP
jgi:hypothetical protein